MRVTGVRGWWVVVAMLALSTAVSAQGLFDEAIPPGVNFDKAEFRLWLPAGVKRVRAVLVLVPGSNGDGRHGRGCRVAGLCQ